MIFVSGPSGSGKTTTLKTFIEKNSEFTLLTASSILKQIGRPTQRLNFEDLNENQISLRRWLVGKSIGSKVIWDGHTIIPSEQGLYYLPLDFFVDLPIHTLIFLKTDPSVLARRAGLSDSCALKISELQMIELGYMKDLSNALKCQFKIIPSASQNLLEETLLEYGITTSRN